jgi:hypothetical protein
MLPEIGAALSATKSTIEMAKALKNIDNKVERNQIIYDITEKLIEVQQTTLEAQEHLLKLIEENKNLKGTIDDLESSEKDFENYYLNELPAGAKVFTIKADSVGDGPVHHICPDCKTTKKQKSILQGRQTLRCCVCKFNAQATHWQKPKVILLTPHPEEPPSGGISKDPLHNALVLRDVR